MMDLAQAIARVRSFFEPPTQFVSGTRIFEPERDDPLGGKKRAIIRFAATTADGFERSKSHTPADLAVLERKVKEFHGCVDDPEAQDYLELLRAVGELIAVGRGENHQ